MNSVPKSLLEAVAASAMSLPVIQYEQIPGPAVSDELGTHKCSEHQLTASRVASRSVRHRSDSVLFNVLVVLWPGQGRRCTSIGPGSAEGLRARCQPPKYGVARPSCLAGTGLASPWSPEAAPAYSDIARYSSGSR